MALETAFNASATISFVVKNASTNSSIKVFGHKILPLNHLDLMKIPGVTEEDIRASLLKGSLKALLANGRLTIVSSTVNLATADSGQQAALAASGLPGAASSVLKGDVADIAALKLIDISGEADFAERRVLTLLQTFQLNKTSAATADDIMVVEAAGGTGRWVRQLTPVARWTDQTSWYVDQSNGNDENVGSTSGAPLKTVAEFTRRLRAVKYSINATTYTMTLMSDIGLYNATTNKYRDSFQWDFSLISDGYLNNDQDSGITRSLLQINGATPTTVNTGTLSAATVALKSNSASTITRNDEVGWNVGDVVEFINDASGGAVGVRGRRVYVLAVSGDNNEVAQISPWVFDSGQVPAGTEAFKVISLTKWGPQISGYGTQGGHRIQIDNVELPGLSAPHTFSDGVPSEPAEGDGCPDYELGGFVLRFRNTLSRISVTGGIAGRVRWGHNNTNPVAIIKPATGYNEIQNSFMTIERGDVIANYVSFVNCIIDVMNIRGILTLSRSCLVNGCIRMGLKGASSYVQTEAGPTFVRLDRVSFFDFPATIAANPFVGGSGDPGAALIMKRGAACQVRGLYGSSNDGYGLDISEGSSLYLQDWANYPCLVNGGNGEILIDNDDPIPSIDTDGTPVAGVNVRDWTGEGAGTLAGGDLGGFAHNLKNGTKIVTVD